MADAVAALVDAPVERVVPIEEGLNATARIDLADGRRAVLKAATYATDPELLAEAAFLARLEEAPVPTSRLLAAVPSDEGPLDVAAFLMAHREGRREVDVLALSPAARERLVREAGRHLAAIHEPDAPAGFGPVRVDLPDTLGSVGIDSPDEFGSVGVDPPDGIGSVGVDPPDGIGPDGESEGTLVVAEPAGSWPDRFETLVEGAVRGLRGEGAVTDDDGRFADLAPAVEDAFGGFADLDAGRDPEPALLHGDYRPANLLLAAEADADPLVRAVLDVGPPATDDGPLDVALAEDALVDVPLGGTAEAERLREVLRTAYAAGRGRRRTELFDARYPYYRLLARTRRLGSFGYWHRFAREAGTGTDAEDDVARRWRGFVRERLAELAD